MKSDFDYSRRKTWTVTVGNISLGGENPIRIQSMTSTSTIDTDASVAQTKRIADAGGEIVRLTAQGVREADNIGVIRKLLRAEGCNVPLVADIHFNPRAAFAAACVTDKVRINPGNFVDAARTFKKLTYTDEEYAHEITRISDALIPFIAVCREHHTAVRIGVNHGSLSDRIMSRYGDTPAGMVESAMEFLRVFAAEKFLDVVISIKASNTVVMVETVRRLVAAMDSEDMHFPLHLGVTEAGDGEDGRIKSAVGIGTLLSQGIGDTIRVSLSEEPECEIPVARKLVDYIAGMNNAPHINGSIAPGYNTIIPQHRISRHISCIDSKINSIVIGDAESWNDARVKPDIVFSEHLVEGNFPSPQIIPAANYFGEWSENIMPLFTIADVEAMAACKAPQKWLMIDAAKSIDMNLLRDVNIILTTIHPNIAASLQSFLHRMIIEGIDSPVIIAHKYADTDMETIQVKAGVDMGSVLMNGFVDGLWLSSETLNVVDTAYGILQAARLRTTKTEFISCPGCGRTLFDLQNTVKQVKQATSHLKHLKIGIMGCIVNGPGEMADADYGYVGAAAGKISLYKGKKCIEMNIPQEEAITHLISLIKENGDWVNPT